LAVNSSSSSQAMGRAASAAAFRISQISVRASGGRARPSMYVAGAVHRSRSVAPRWPAASEATGWGMRVRGSRMGPLRPQAAAARIAKPRTVAGRILPIRG